MSKEKDIVPELRFPEFEKEVPWVQKKLGEEDVSFLVSEKTNRKNLSLDNYISTENMLPDYAGICAASKLPSTKKVTEFTEGDILISNIRPYLKKVWRSNMKGGASNDILVFRSGSKVTSDFLEFILKNDRFIKYVMQSAKGVKMPRGDKDSIQEYKVLIPSKPEQQKIADCLSSLDALIAAHRDKLDALRSHKKGLMQNLFPQEGERVPRYRFEGFEGEWEETALGDSADFINGRAYKKEELLKEGKYRVLRVGNFFTNKEWFYSDLELDEDKYCEKGDLLYAWSASFGPYLWEEEKVIYHYHIWKVVNKHKVDKLFLYYLLDYETFRMKSESLNGFALKHLTKGAIENWQSRIPTDKKEQQKIAACLFSVDELIAAQTDRIDQLQEHKRGLMQGLFPKTNG